MIPYLELCPDPKSFNQVSCDNIVGRPFIPGGQIWVGYRQPRLIDLQASDPLHRYFDCGSLENVREEVFSRAS